MEGAIEIGKGLYWVGVRDPELTLFDELYPTKFGTTYNSYLVKGSGATAIIDTVRGKRFEEFLAKIREVQDPAEIDYIVVNHSEPDHSGALSQLLQYCTRAKVLSTQAARTFLGNQIHRSFSAQVVKDGETLDLGGRTLRFIAAPFLHWPDTMFTFVQEEGILFSCDAFGSHYTDKTGNTIFADQVPDFSEEMRYYFDTIMRPFKDRIRTALAKLDGTEVRMLCPSHGPIFRRDARGPIELYRKLAEPKPGAGKRVVVFYISPHGNTEKMAEAVAAGASAAGVHATLCRITEASRDEVRDLMEENDALIFGTPTINRDIPEPMWRVLSYLSTVSPRAEMAAVFGSYGWSGEACKLAEERLKSLGFKLPVPHLRNPFTPTEDALAECQALGRSVAEEVLKKP